MTRWFLLVLLVGVLLVGTKVCAGQRLGQEILDHVPPEALNYITQCSSDQQVVMCGELLPLETPDAIRNYRHCCWLFAPVTLPPAAQAARDQAAAAQAAIAATVSRPDLDLSATGRYPTAPDWLWNSSGVVNGKNVMTCVAKGSVTVPAFSTPQQVALSTSTVPLLTSKQIQAVKSRSLAQGSMVTRAVRHAALRLRAAVRRTAGSSMTFIHPGAIMGASEVSLMQVRLNASISPQAGALQSMLTGAGVPPKYYRYNASIVWNPPTDCPASWAPGPYSMATVSIKYGGYEAASSDCPANYPLYAPGSICGHISFVEMDAQMIYKQVLAYYATQDTRYSQNVLSTLSAWASTNRAFGMSSQNGPLEGGWGIAAMARSLEMLRSLPSFLTTRTAFMNWFNAYVKPEQTSYVDVSTANAVASGNLNFYSNWHATIAESWMTVAVLSDDSALFTKASDLYKLTVKNYFRWGRDPAYTANRTVGESTETLRDIYHTEFGLGGLIQTAELAWQQNIDLYSYYQYAIVAAMELHARIINAWDAGKNEAMLPPAMKFYDTSMPAPPANTHWSFDTTTQLWTARDTNNNIVSTLRDGYKYIVGVTWLPTGWEVGYNHYYGRLGIRMPETAALLSRYPVEHHVFHWGQGTLSHADTAYQLWRPGVSASTLCV